MSETHYTAWDGKNSLSLGLLRATYSALRRTGWNGDTMVVKIHPSMLPEAKLLPNFIDAIDYRALVPMPHEVGAAEVFRFVCEPTEHEQ